MTTNAERQASYRRRHADAGGGRINHAVSAHAEAGLRRLAKHYGATQRAMLERLTVRHGVGVGAAAAVRISFGKTFCAAAGFLRGYRGCHSHFRYLISCHRPRPKAEANLRLRTLPGEQAQVDWQAASRRSAPKFSACRRMPTQDRKPCSR